MSLSKRIPKDRVRMTTEMVVQDDKRVAKEADYKKETLQEFMDNLNKTIQTQKEEAKRQIDDDKKNWVEKYKQEIRHEMVQAAKKELEDEYAERLAEANRCYEEANAYKETLFKEAKEYQQKYMKVHEEEWLSFMFSIIELFLRDKADSSDERVALLKGLIQQIPYDCKGLKIAIHPSDYSYLKGFEENGEVRFVMDMALSSGDCVIETQREFIDGKLAVRLDQIKAALNEGRSL